MAVDRSTLKARAEAGDTAAARALAVAKRSRAVGTEVAATLLLIPYLDSEDRPVMQ